MVDENKSKELDASASIGERLDPDSVIELVIGQMDGVLSVVGDLEIFISKVLLGDAAIDADLIKRMQAFDFLRQSIVDARSVLAEVSPNLKWIDGIGISLVELMDSVAMRSSLDGMVCTGLADSGNDSDDIWL